MRWFPVALAIPLIAGACAPETDVLRDRRSKMGTFFEIQLRAPDAPEAREAIDAAFTEIDRVEALLSEWRETSEISAVNARAGVEPVAVGEDLLAVVRRAGEISVATGGAFDITFAACGGLWSFREPRVPTDAELDACLPRVGWRRVVADPATRTLFLPEPGMRIGIAGIGKGYGVDRAAAILEARGFRDWLVDGGGDIRLSSSDPSRPWRIGIAHPRERGRLFGAIERTSGAVVTSGDYEAWFERDGVRYHHILDPRTGRPARGAAGVTVIAPDATTADALATGLFVMGPERGMRLAERLDGVAALFLDSDLDTTRTRGFPEVRGAPAHGGG